jgi:hypothetical protein
VEQVPDQLRSARAVRVGGAAIEVSAGVVEEPMDVPAAGAALVLGAGVVVAIGVPPGVPVVPMGVDCELWVPAPVAGFFAAGLGGVLWAMAVPIIATAAMPASRRLAWLDAVMEGTP